METVLNYKEMKKERMNKKQGGTLDYTQLRIEYNKLKKEAAANKPKSRRIVLK